MKITMEELRRLVAESVRMTITEARKKTKKDSSEKKSSDIPTRTEDAELLRRDKHVRGTGYSHMNNGDFSQPLGDRNLYRRQGAANFGGFTATAESHLRALIDRIVAEEVHLLRRK